MRSTRGSGKRDIVYDWHLASLRDEKAQLTARIKELPSDSEEVLRLIEELFDVQRAIAKLV